MRTRSSAKNQQKTPEADPPKTRRSSAGRAKQLKNTEQSSVEGGDVSAGVEVTPETEVSPSPKTVGKRSAGKAKTPSSRRSTRRVLKSAEAATVTVGESDEKEEEDEKEEAVDLKDIGPAAEEYVARNAGGVEEEKPEETADQSAGDSMKIKQCANVKATECVELQSANDGVESVDKEQAAGSSVEEAKEKSSYGSVEELEKKGAITNAVEVPPVAHTKDSLNQEECVGMEGAAIKVDPPVGSAEESIKQEELDKKETYAMEVELPQTSADVSLRQEQSDKEEGITTKVEDPSVTNTIQYDKNEGTAMKSEVPAVTNTVASPLHEECDKKEGSSMEMEVPSFANAKVSLKEGEPLQVGPISVKTEEPNAVKDGEEVTGKSMEGTEIVGDKDAVTDSVNVGENVNTKMHSNPHEKEEQRCDSKMGKHGDQVNLKEHEKEDAQVADQKDPVLEAEALEEDHRELTTAVNDHKKKKESEIFVGGLERDATEEDVRNVFENIGKVVEVRLHKNPSTNKNKGYAFVKFAEKDHAKRALEEMKNPVICGKQCGTAPCEDNNTLFLGNICNTWTKEAIRQKLQEYGVEGVESITLVPDGQREGFSRGFAFVEFSCHADAMHAYKRLQKPDAVFGHPERTAKVAFAEPLREPDPDVMAKVKTVFLDGLPPHWNEDRIREQFKGFGEIVRVVLARNMSNAKRKDFGFIDFSTHEAAIACIDAISNTELGDANAKTKVKARLSNPLPKTQAVKGGLCGGFRIGHGGFGTTSNFGKNYGRGIPHPDRANFRSGHGAHRGGRGQFGRGAFPVHGAHQGGRGQFGRGGFPVHGAHQGGRGQFGRGGFPVHDAHQGGRGQFGRGGFPIHDDYDYSYNFRGRQMLGEETRRGSYRGGHASGGPPAFAAPARPSLDRPWHDAPNVGRGRHIPPSRQPYTPEGDFGRLSGSNFADPYRYDGNFHGMKRPFHMTDPSPDYMGPSSIRPRLDYSNPGVQPYGNPYPDATGPGGNPYPHDYYGSDNSGGPGRGHHPSYNGGVRPYGGGYY